MSVFVGACGGGSAGDSSDDSAEVAPSSGDEEGEPYEGEGSDPQCAMAPSCGPDRTTYSDQAECEAGGTTCEVNEVCGSVVYCRPAGGGEEVAPD
ncbi:MAG: hypothetical protein AB7S26_20695 [Sandaracinaceae bacterium]